MSNSIERLSKITKLLEDRFFYAENLVLKRQLARLKREKESQEALSKVSGIVNRSVLRELVAFSIRPETLAAMSLVPIIEVAWADGAIDVREQKAILAAAKQQGLGADHAILREWLRTKPDAKLMRAWKNYMWGICEILSKKALAVMKKEIVEHTRAVAGASGGFLGLTNRVSPAERTVLDTVESLFEKQGPCGDEKE